MKIRVRAFIAMYVVRISYCHYISILKMLPRFTNVSLSLHFRYHRIEYATELPTFFISINSLESSDSYALAHRQ